MIGQRTFLGISLRTVAHRRALVLAFYGLLLAFVSIPLCRHRFMPAILAGQVFYLGSFFGGIRGAGVVKPYSESVPPTDPSVLDPISLNLSGRMPFSSPSYLLDEREVHTRDRAHYRAYWILSLSAILALALYWGALEWKADLLRNNDGTLAWLAVVYLLSLPQSVILWTEPEPMAEGGLTLVGSKV